MHIVASATLLLLQSPAPERERTELGSSPVSLHKRRFRPASYDFSEPFLLLIQGLSFRSGFVLSLSRAEGGAEVAMGIGGSKKEATSGRLHSCKGWLFSD